MKSTLIKCGWLVTLDPAIGEMKGGELLISGSTIKAAGRNLNATADETIKPEDNYIANTMGALAQIDAGVTTLVDWCHNITSIEHAERAVDGLVDSGIRAVFAHGTAKPIGLETGTPFTQVPHPRDRIEHLRKGRLASDDARVTLAMAILGPDWGAWEVVEHDIKMAREFGLVSSSHTRRREDCVVPDGYKRMAKAGLLGPDHNLVHGTSYDTADLRVVVDNGASLTSTVLVELHHHIGDTMVAAYREQGGLPSLGIDVELYTSGQMFREMQAGLLFARGKEVRNNVLRGNSPLKSIPVRSREALEWATINGAKAFRLDSKIGTLTPGKKADIVMLNADDVNMVPVYDPIYSIVEIAGAGNVDTVIIDGEIRKRNGELTGDGATLRRRTAELKESGLRIMRDGNYRVASAPN
jgi:5-methylthioadenosine/S-adenosylhomocysteine deaminase